MNKMVTYTPAKIKKLRKLYKEAVASGAEMFMLDGDEYLTSYAKYLLEYLDGENS